MAVLKPVVGCRAAVSPSYHVQALFAEHAGAWLAHSSVNLSVISDLAVSVTCSDHACKQMACKVWLVHIGNVSHLSTPGRAGQDPLYILPWPHQHPRMLECTRAVQAEGLRWQDRPHDSAADPSKLWLADGQLGLS